ncbi:MAG: Lrp/AsnC family transcriptional regulator [Halocynthiibacter sp.]
MAQFDMDRYDAAILEILSGEARISITDLAARIGLSKTPTQARLKRLETHNVIKGYRAMLDPIQLKRDHVAFVEVRLSDTRERALREFNIAVRKISEIEECYMLAASFDYLLKIRTKDMRDYRMVLAEKLSSLPHISNTSTHVAMQAVKESAF